MKNRITYILIFLGLLNLQLEGHDLFVEFYKETVIIVRKEPTEYFFEDNLTARSVIPTSWQIEDQSGNTITSPAKKFISWDFPPGIFTIIANYIDPVDSTITCRGEFKLINCELEIYKVPEYLFADANYATPIYFRINGLPPNFQATLLSAEITFFANDDNRKSIQLTDRISDEQGRPVSGISNSNYAAYIPSGFFKDIILPEPHIQHRSFFALNLKINNLNSDLEIYSGFCPNAMLKAFADINVKCIEGPNIREKVYENQKIQDYSIRLYGQKVAQLWNSGGVFPYNTFSIPFHLQGSDYEYFFDGATISSSSATVNFSNTGVALNTEIVDDGHPRSTNVGFSNVEVSLGNYGVREGITFHTSYRGKQIPILPGNEMAMDILSQNQGYILSVELFNSGIGTVKKTTESSGVLYENIHDTLDQNTFGIFSVIFDNFKTLKAFYSTSNTIFEIINKTSMIGSHSGSASAEISSAMIFNTPNGSKGKFRVDLIQTNTNLDSQTITSEAINLSDHTIYTLPGYQWSFFVLLNSDATIRTNGPLNQTYSSSQCQFQVNSTNDFLIFTAMTR